MKKFNSFQEYLDLTKDAQVRGLRNINCYLMPDEICQLIQNESLFFMQSENTFQIVVKHDRYCKVYFYANENFKFIPFENGLPIIVDLPYSRVMSERMINFRQKLESQGFVLNSSTSRMACSDFEELPLDMREYAIEKLNPCDIDAIVDIWEENFDAVQNLLYSKGEIKKNQNPIYVLKDAQGKILGAMEMVINGSYGWVQKIAIKKSEQGKGLGGILERFYINRCKSLGIKTLLLYTIDINLNAQNFHKKFGFQPDGKYNCQFIYQLKGE